MKNLLHTGSLFMLMVLAFSSCASQKTAKGSGEDYAALIDSRRFTFEARTVIPTEDSRFNPRFMFPNGNNLYQLGSGYEVKITPDSVIAYLPFFGRSFTAPVDPTKGGIQFTSTDFDYQQSIKKKNYQITITPKDNRDIRSLFLTITPSGYAYVQVSSMNKTPIAFNGIIEKDQ
jgi:hypothetical protein